MERHLMECHLMEYHLMECYSYVRNKTTQFNIIPLFSKTGFYYFSNCVKMIAFFTLL
jgi:hypothetical protein